MGWRDRDWAKFDENEWNSFVTTTSAPRRRTFRASAVVVLAGLLSLAAMITFRRLHVTLPRVHSRSNVVRIKWSPTDQAPAATPGRICVSVHGSICVAYAAGEIPADVMTQRLELDGFSVR